MPVKKAPATKKDPNPIFKRPVNSETAPQFRARQDSINLKKYGTKNPSPSQIMGDGPKRVIAKKPTPVKPSIKSTGKLSGRAMRGGKRMTAGKLDGL